jgi:hypothetical protein
VRKPNYIVFFVVLLVLLIPSISEAQCAMCKQAASSSLENDPRSMARSLNSGILYLMAVPYLMLAIIFRKQIKAVFLNLKAKFVRTPS